jgi:DNA-binding LacI/PurR family transcriptional regulator
MSGEGENSHFSELCRQMVDAIHGKRLVGKLPGRLKLAMKFKTSPFHIKEALHELLHLDLIEMHSEKHYRVKYKGRVAVLFMNRRIRREHYDHPQLVFGSLLDGIEKRLAKSGRKVQVHLISPGQREFIDLLEREVDAFIVVTALNIFKDDFRVFNGYPWVRAMGSPAVDTPVAHVTYDNDVIGRIAADYLLEKGCRRFVFFGSANNHLFFSRLKKFQDRVVEAGRYCMEHVEVDINIMPEEEIMKRAVRAFAPMAGCDDPIGIFNSADIYAPTLYQALLSLGFKPMHDIQIVSCDNNEEYLKNLTARPPSIDIKMREIGTTAAEMALGDLDSNEKIILTPELKF